MTLSTQIRVYIVEDQPRIQRDIQRLVQNQPGTVVVGISSSVEEAIVAIPKARPDVLLLDIHLNDGTGFDILEQIPNRNFKVIFLTAYKEHAIRAIKHEAFDYLLKPVNEAELHQALQRVFMHGHQPSMPDSTDNPQAGKSSERLVLSSQNYLHIVDFADIIFCQSDFGYTTFHLTANRKIVTSKYIKEYEDDLPAKLFIRTHQSFFVNLKFIETYHKDGYLILKDKTKVPVSVRRKEEVLQHIKTML